MPTQNQSGTDLHSGLEEVKAVPTKISSIEGKALSYRGIVIEELVEKACFEEVIYLLWYGRLPGSKELQRLDQDLKENAELPLAILDTLHHVPRESHPMAILRTLLSQLSLYEVESDSIDAESNFRSAIKIQARIPNLVAAIARHKKAKSSIPPDKELSFSENFLYMLNAKKPDKISVDALEACLILYAEHELNASTFVARISTGTLADVYSSVTAAVASLKGILHGGANERVLNMIMDVNKPELAHDYILDQLKKKNRIMGFGHPVYKEGDPRAKILKKLSAELLESRGFGNYIAIAEKIETTMMQEKNLRPNVDFFTALCFFALGFPADMFTSVFAVSRCSGWLAHILEQFENNRMIRPRAEYTGPVDVGFTPIENR